MSVCVILSINISVCVIQSICLWYSINLSVCVILSIYLSVCVILSIYLSVLFYQYIYLSLLFYQYICLSVLFQHSAVSRPFHLCLHFNLIFLVSFFSLESTFLSPLIFLSLPCFSPICLYFYLASIVCNTFQPLFLFLCLYSVYYSMTRFSILTKYSC